MVQLDAAWTGTVAFDAAVRSHLCPGVSLLETCSAMCSCQCRRRRRSACSLGIDRALTREDFDESKARGKRRGSEATTRNRHPHLS